MARLSSYAGYYKGNFLRSSYEYVFAKFLEKQGLKYKTEVKTYLLPSGSYKPDFFIYNSNNELIKIIEIKSDKKSELEKGRIKINELKELVDVEVVLYSYKELKKLCDENFLKIYPLMEKWKTELASINYRICRGENNPAYGIKRTVEWKESNGKRVKELFKDENFQIKHSKAVKKSMNTPEIKEKIRLGNLKRRKKVIKLRCPMCNKEYNGLENGARNKKFCSVKCSSKYASELAKKINMSKKNEEVENINYEVKVFIENHKEFISELQIDRKAKFYLKPHILGIALKFNLKDDRAIFNAIFGRENKHKTNYQQLLKYFKSMI